MISATVEAEASVNFGAFEWTTIAGNSAHISRVDDAIRNHGGELPWGKQFATRIVRLPGEVVIAAADRIGQIPGHDPFWAIERMDDGALGTRKCGVMLFYSMNHDQVRTHGLPHVSQIEAAFREDALAVLKSAYEKKATEQFAGPALIREFPPHSLTHEGEWAKALREIREGHMPKDVNPSIGATSSFAERHSPQKSSLWSNPSLRHGMIVAGVALGAALTGYLAYRYLKNNEPEKSR